MARPPTQLITRESAGVVALSIIDREGLEAFSVPRLARDMGVTTSSLYHHFSDRSEILSVVAQLIVSSTAQARRPSDRTLWREWLVQQSLNLRTAILRHRNAAPVLVQFLPRYVMIELFDGASAYLLECGVPIELHVQILDAVETLSVGGSITEAMRPRGGSRSVFGEVDPVRLPAISAAVAANTHTAKTLYTEALRAYLRGVDGVAQPTS
jgi:TetR/AcrR family tetracycline transcriptional repressor